MELEDYWRILRRGWLIVVVTTIVGGLLAFGWSLRQPMKYSATTQSFVAISDTSLVNNSIVTGAQYIEQRVNSYALLASSPQVLDPVIAELGLPENASQLSAQVTAVSIPQTVLINVTATYNDPVMAATIANSVSVQFGTVISAIERTPGANASPVKLTIVVPAQPPSTPSSPRTNLNALLGALVGLLAGSAFLALRETLDTSVSQQDDVEEITGATPLALMGDDPSASDKPLVALDQKAQRSEAFRSLRTNLQFVDVDNPPRVIAITSPLSSEGKTTSACNLAITMAQAGLNVCLVETDLRRPRVATYLGIDGSIGITNVLAGQVDLDDVLVEWGRGLLTVLLSGPIPPNPSELLASKNFGVLLEQLRDRFDMVIVDTCPLLPVTDGAIACAAADGAVLVVRHSKTRKEQLHRALDSLSQVDARVLGTVVNFVPTKRRAGGYGDGYGYGYGYGYSDDKPAGRKRGRKAVRTEVSPQQKQATDSQPIVVPASEG